MLFLCLVLLLEFNQSIIKHQSCSICSPELSLFLITARHDADNLNKMKNLASKIIGDKMKVRQSNLCLDGLAHLQLFKKNSFYV